MDALIADISFKDRLDRLLEKTATDPGEPFAPTHWNGSPR